MNPEKAPPSRPRKTKLLARTYTSTHIPSALSSSRESVQTSLLGNSTGTRVSLLYTYTHTCSLAAPFQRVRVKSSFSLSHTLLACGNKLSLAPSLGNPYYVRASPRLTPREPHPLTHVARPRHAQPSSRRLYARDRLRDTPENNYNNRDGSRGRGKLRCCFRFGLLCRRRVRARGGRSKEKVINGTLVPSRTNVVLSRSRCDEEKITQRHILAAPR